MAVSDILAIAAITLATIVVIFEAAFFIIRTLHARATAKDHAELAREMSGFLEEIRRLMARRGWEQNQVDKAAGITLPTGGAVPDEALSGRESLEPQLTSAQTDSSTGSPGESGVEEAERNLEAGDALASLATKYAEDAVESRAHLTPHGASGGPRASDLSNWERRILIQIALHATAPLTPATVHPEPHRTAERLEALGLIRGSGEPGSKIYTLTKLGRLMLEDMLQGR